MPQRSMRNRPARIRIEDELGQSRTLDSGGQAFTLLREGRQVLVLGLGPEPHAAPGADGPGWYLESPEFASRMSEAWSPPDHWQGLAAESRDIHAEASRQGLDLQDARIWLYRQGPKLFPSFWGPVLARLRLALSTGERAQGQGRIILLPERENGLLVRELARAFKDCGYYARQVQARDTSGQAGAVLSSGRSDLFFSVNFQGLDPYGQDYHLYREAGNVVASWCVDNPWHILSGIKAPYWKRMPLFVTDESFIPELLAHGAEEVWHLPLAADPDMFHPEEKSEKDLEGRVVFAGRSSFPGKAAFFAGCQLDPALREKSQALMASGKRADFQWWKKELGLDKAWPGNGIRLAGLGAEEAGRWFRAETLRSIAAEISLTVFGDDGWREFLDGKAELRPPVDYYGSLRRVYGSAALNLNCPSPLLPAGLTQRHFDVWAAGGLLLSDDTPGLDLFPRDLVEPVVFSSPGEAPAAARRLLDSAGLARELSAQWRALILAEHTYRHRAERVLESLGLERQSGKGQAILSQNPEKTCTSG